MLYKSSIECVLILLIQAYIIEISSHAIDIQDTNIFEIALDNLNYDEESENEMIQQTDLKDLKPLAKDENKYKPLHSYVQRYNEHNNQNKIQFTNTFPYFRPHIEEIINVDREDKQLITGFKHELDKTTKRTTTTHKVQIITENYSTFNKRRMQNSETLQNGNDITKLIADKNIKNAEKRREIEHFYGTTMQENMDFLQVISNKNVTISERDITGYFGVTQITHNMYKYDKGTISGDTEKDILQQFWHSEKRSTFAYTESPDEEPYDYKKFKVEYEQQLEYSIRHNKTFNYTKKEELDDMPREVLKRIMDLKPSKNCTIEKPSQTEIKAIKCFIYDYQHMKDMKTLKRLLLKTWLVLRVWLLIYICLAVPCWCQRGWCCCCFCCKFCFPRERILFIKQYYTTNPPGILVKDLKKETETKQYEAMEYEYDAYERFGAAIRNI